MENLEDALHAREWLEADGLGGFASGTVGQVRTRRYHALLLAATTPPTGRAVLVAGFDAAVERDGIRHTITAQAYGDGIASPPRTAPLAQFESEPWPRWTYALPDGTRLVQELFAVHGSPRVAVGWSLVDASGGAASGRLIVRPFLAARDYHALLPARPEREVLLAPPRAVGDALVFATPAGLPPIAMRSNAAYHHVPHWYRDFFLAEENARGFDAREDLASPGEWSFDLSAGPAWWIVEAGADANVRTGIEAEPNVESGSGRASERFETLRARESARRARFESPLDRAAESYLVRRGPGHSIVAGYPWFTDWGRDTFIALRGLCLARMALDPAREILLEWAGAIRDGMLPNRFADRGEAAEYNAVDASLWFVVCVEEFFRACELGGRCVEACDSERLERSVDSILSGYARGTRHGIHLDRDGLLAAGEAGVQLTWMDARVGSHVVTPRIGKPVEIQALWWNALRCGTRFDARWGALADRARASFAARFWNAGQGMLYDVVDADHVPDRVDASFRPNQLFAIGGLPFALVEGLQAERVVAACERALWTPAGLRTLAPDDPAYVPCYGGGPTERDLAYHQGTVWPWLAGAFVEAWVRVRGSTPAARREARRQFVVPLMQRLTHAGLGHLCEIADAESPHAPKGCPFQAWSLAELIRLERIVLAD